MYFYIPMMVFYVLGAVLTFVYFLLGWFHMSLDQGTSGSGQYKLYYLFLWPVEWVRLIGGLILAFVMPSRRR